MLIVSCSRSWSVSNVLRPVVCSFALYGGLASSCACLLSAWVSVVHGGLIATWCCLLALCVCCWKLQRSGRCSILLPLVITSCLAPLILSFATLLPVQFCNGNVRFVCIRRHHGLAQHYSTRCDSRWWSTTIASCIIGLLRRTLLCAFHWDYCGLWLHTIRCCLLVTACVFSATVMYLPVAIAILLALFWHIVCPSPGRVQFCQSSSRKFGINVVVLRLSELHVYT